MGRKSPTGAGVGCPWVIAPSVDEEGGGRDGGDILAACEPRDKLIKQPSDRKGLSWAGSTSSARHSFYPQRWKKAFLTLGPESQPGDPLLTLREWFLPEVRQLIWHSRPVSSEQSTREIGDRVDRVQHPLPIPGASGMREQPSVPKHFPGHLT